MQICTDKIIMNVVKNQINEDRDIEKNVKQIRRLYKNTHYLSPHCVVISQQCHHIAPLIIVSAMRELSHQRSETIARAVTGSYVKMAEIPG